MIASDRQSIFGDTYKGVPNPQIPFQHPYPTRYHGPIFTTPRFGTPFISNPYGRAPYAGLGAAPSPAREVVGAVLWGAVSGAVIGAVAGAVAGRGGKAGSNPEKVGRTAGVATGVVGPAIAAVLTLTIAGTAFAVSRK